MAKITTSAATAEPHEPLYTAPAPKPAIHVPATPRFLYFCRADRMIILHGRVLPFFDKMAIDPGMNGVLSTGDPTKAIQAKLSKGWTLIPPDIDGDGTSYARKYTNNAGKDVWLDQHEIVYHGSSRIADGSEPFSAWVAGLVDAGKIAAPLDYVVRAHLEEIRQDAAAIEDRDLKSEVLVLTALRSGIEACEAFLAESPAGEIAAAAPVPAKGAKK